MHDLSSLLTFFLPHFDIGEVRQELEWFLCWVAAFLPFELFSTYFKGSSFKELRTFLCLQFPMPRLYSGGIQDCPT